MKYIEEYLKEKVRVQPLGRVTYVDDEDSAGWSGMAVKIDDVETAIFISHADYAEWLESKLDALKAKNEQQSEEKPEEKPENSIEPRFKVGDWVIAKDNGETAWLITAIGANYSDYSMVSLRGSEDCVDYSYVDKNCRLWNIKDAKDGDVLYMNNEMAKCVFIYKSSKNGIIDKYASYSNFGFEKGSYLVLNDGYAIPATKEQRDILFAKMQESGYEWDADNKKLKKQDEPKDYNSIDPHFGKPIETEPKFKVGDWIFSPEWGTARIIGTGVCGTNIFLLEYTDGTQENTPIEYVNSAFDKWDIKNTKNGDVLASGNSVFIFRVFHGGWLACHCSAHRDGTCITDSYDLVTDKYFEDIFPATKEQREFLYQTLKENGYEWDNQKKLIVRVP